MAEAALLRKLEQLGYEREQALQGIAALDKNIADNPETLNRVLDIMLGAADSGAADSESDGAGSGSEGESEASEEDGSGSDGAEDDDGSPQQPRKLPPRRAPARPSWEDPGDESGEDDSQATDPATEDYGGEAEDWAFVAEPPPSAPAPTRAPAPARYPALPWQAHALSARCFALLCFAALRCFAQTRRPRVSPQHCQTQSAPACRRRDSQLEHRGHAS
jgi:hypothetical protein